jgi:hypothetical protein
MTIIPVLTSADYLATLGGQIHPPICPGGVPAVNYSVFGKKIPTKLVALCLIKLCTIWELTCTGHLETELGGE